MTRPGRELAVEISVTRQRGGVGGEDRVGADDPVERAEDRLLDLERLDDGLDDEVGVGEVAAATVVKVIRPSSSACSRLGQLLALHRAAGGVLEVLAAAVDGRRRLTSTPTTAKPLRAKTSAMPAPMVPRPITPMVVNSRVSCVASWHACSHGARARGCGNSLTRQAGRTTTTSSPGRTCPARPPWRTAHAGGAACPRAVDEGHRVLAEARDELGAAVVGLVGHHDHGRPRSPPMRSSRPAGRLSWPRSRSRNMLVAGVAPRAPGPGPRTRPARGS